MNEKYFFLIVLLSSLIIIPKIRSANDASRMATVQALVEHHSFSIDSTKFKGTNDRVFIKGKYYSDKPPFPSLLAAIVYFPIHFIGLSLDYEWNLAYFLIILLTIKSIWIISIFYFYKLLDLIHFTGNKILLTSFLAFGSLYFSWSSTFNNHILAGSFLLLGFYFWVKAKLSGFNNIRSVFLSGLYFLVAGISDIPVLLFFFGFLLLLFLPKPQWKSILIFLLPVSLTLLPYLLHNYFISGSVKPFQIEKQFFEYPNSIWVKNNALSGVEQNSPQFVLTNAFQLLVGSKGFLIYSPITFISIWTLIFYRKKFTNVGREIWISFICGFLIFGYYSFYSTNLSGGSYSIRWFVPFLPMIIFFSFPFFEEMKEIKNRIIKLLLILSIIISTVGIINPWSKTYYSENSFVANIINAIHYYKWLER